MIMKKIFKSLALLLTVVFTLSACEKHEIIYNADEVDSDAVAEFQLLNFIPSTSSSQTLLNAVVLNDTDTIATVNYPLKRYNGIPLGSTTRFFTRKPGTYTIKCFKKAGSTTPDYEGTFTLTAGKQEVYLHSWTADPLILDANYPYGNGANSMPGTVSDTTLHLNFVNLWYESAGVPCSSKVQYQYCFRSYSTGYTEWQDLGDAVGFGEQTGFHSVSIPNKGIGYYGGPSSSITNGYANLYTRSIRIDTGKVLPYITDSWTDPVPGFGRYINHVLRGAGRANYIASSWYSL